MHFVEQYCSSLSMHFVEQVMCTRTKSP